MRAMSERGSLATDGPTACPFVAFEDDRELRARAPDRRHRCYAEPVPAPRAIAHQEHYCLAPAFPACPTFLDWARREAARPGDAGRPGASRPVAAASDPDDVDVAVDWHPARRAAEAGRPGASGDATDGEGRRTPRPTSRAVPRLRNEARDSGLWGADEVEATRHRDWAAPPPWLAVRGGDTDVRDEEDRARRQPAEAGTDSEAPTGRRGRRGAGGPDEEDDAVGARWLPAGRDVRGESAREVPGAPPDRKPRDLDSPAEGELARHLDSVAAPGDLSRVRERRDTRPDTGDDLRARRPLDGGARHGEPASFAEDARAALPEGAAGRLATPMRPSRPGARSGAGPAVAQARPALGGRAPRDPAAPAWERPRRLEAYPSLRTRVGLPDVPRLAIYALAVLAAALVLFFAPTFLSGGSGTRSTPSPSAGGTQRASAAPRTPAAPTPLVYTVVDGDTLSGIAAHFGLTMDQLVKANPQIKNPDRLGIGDELTIPARTPSKPVPVGPGASASPAGSEGAAP